VAIQKNFDPNRLNAAKLEKIKLEDGTPVEPLFI